MANDQPDPAGPITVDPVAATLDDIAAACHCIAAAQDRLSAAELVTPSLGVALSLSVARVALNDAQQALRPLTEPESHS